MEVVVRIIRRRTTIREERAPRKRWSLLSLVALLTVLLVVGIAAVLNNRKAAEPAPVQTTQRLTTEQIKQVGANNVEAAKIIAALMAKKTAQLKASATTTTVTTSAPAPAEQAPSNPPPPPNPCPKSPEETASAVGGNADSWSVLPETDGQGWKYKGQRATLTHPGYGRIDIDGAQISSGTVEVAEATLWCQATGGEPATESSGTPAPASSSAPKRGTTSPSAPAAPAPPPAPCPTFGGSATTDIGDTGCKYSGSVRIATVPSGYKAIYWDDTSQQTLTGCSGQEIATADASFYQDDGSCVSSPPPAPAGGSTPPTTTAPPATSGGGCPMGTPVTDGGCFVEGWPEGSKVPDGWWANSEFGRIDSGKSVPRDAHVTLYRNGT